MPNRYNEFLHLSNIRAFEKKLGTEIDPEKRAILEQLLAEEIAGKLPHPPDAPPKT